MKPRLAKSRRMLLFGLLGLAVLMLVSRFLLSVPQFQDPTCTVLEAHDGTLLSARIAKDGQWRFPAIDSVPSRFSTCLLHFEDRHYFSHPGIDPRGIARATRANWQAGRVVQGGSTITMQVARMLGKGQERSWANKLQEALLAIHLEINLSKEEILKRYCSHAPFGGNVVGLETAAWRYYGRSPWELSWAESATLAVLPNAPSLIYPGKGQALLLAKRNRLLEALQAEGVIDEEMLNLARLEPLPQRPAAMPSYALHLMDSYLPKREGQRIRSTADARLQRRAQELLNAHVRSLEGIEVYNGALIIRDTETQEILAYAGNASYTRAHANEVDCISSPRNSGSILKPILYAAMLDAGELTPTEIIPDVPTQIADYNPENYTGEFGGAVPANEALVRSLNIPFVRLLQRYGVARFQKQLREQGLSSLTRSPSQYGLTLMLGGAEVRLDELTCLYARMGAGLINPEYAQQNKRWSIYHTFEALTELTRPESREYQRSFTTAAKIAWKTGTSYGNKDAWAIGVTPRYTIGVWCGNADGEGRTGLTGVGSAAPLLFDMADQLPAGGWFTAPSALAYETSLCAQSGYLLGRDCPLEVEVELPVSDYSAVGICPYHQTVFLTDDETKRGSQSCAQGQRLSPHPWFVLPPIQALYYSPGHSDYRSLPPLLPGCELDGAVMQFVYPYAGQRVYIPKTLDGSASRIVCRLAHQVSETEVYWYIDEKYLGSTASIHEMPVFATRGMHDLLVVDAQGQELKVAFEVLSR